MRIAALVISLLVLGIGPLYTADREAAKVPITSVLVKGADSPLVLRDKDSLVTGTGFRPPVEITLVAKTNSTNIRMGYAADQVIFNWEMNPQQLRVDGGPANGKHKNGAGQIPTDKYVTIKWVVTPKRQTILVDDQIRFEHQGDYSAINKPVKVFTHRATITIQALEVKPLPPGTE